jgi:hypothetical protein
MTFCAKPIETDVSCCKETELLFRWCQEKVDRGRTVGYSTAPAQIPACGCAPNCNQLLTRKPEY